MFLKLALSDIVLLACVTLFNSPETLQRCPLLYVTMDAMARNI